jgi:hypothetical protein
MANLKNLILQARSTPASFNAVRSYASETKASPTEVSSILEQRIRGIQEESGLAETGRVLSVGYANNQTVYSSKFLVLIML